MPLLTFRLKKQNQSTTSSENFEKTAPRPSTSRTKSHPTMSITFSEMINVIQSLTNHSEQNSLQETMSSLAIILSFVNLDEDYPKADFKKYEKEQDMTKRLRQLLVSKSKKRARAKLPTRNIAPVCPHGSTKEKKG